ncbi:hypothetical protein GGX14DRAFT_393899 [Mycena pura]|uniref:Uncharacterized protein n=1 Tax=Mycena pura TaxID=153505 RepID=A0AAD6VN01_9AGAR|nr:hypothetical protein GGX14DRAFT_393899 [Mycena pura]
MYKAASGSGSWRFGSSRRAAAARACLKCPTPPFTLYKIPGGKCHHTIDKYCADPASGLDSDLRASVAQCCCSIDLSNEHLEVCSAAGDNLEYCHMRALLTPVTALFALVLNLGIWAAHSTCSNVGFDSPAPGRRKRRSAVRQAAYVVVHIDHEDFSKRMRMPRNLLAEAARECGRSAMRKYSAHWSCIAPKISTNDSAGFQKAYKAVSALSRH